MIESAVPRGELIALSVTSLLETAVLASGEKAPLYVALSELFDDLYSNPAYDYFR